MFRRVKGAIPVKHTRGCDFSTGWLMTSLVRLEGSKPALADHATELTRAFSALIKQILKDLRSYDVCTCRALFIDLSSHFSGRAKTRMDFKTKPIYTHMNRQELRHPARARGLKLRRALQIANLLYETASAYEYEPVYEPKCLRRGRELSTGFPF